MAKKVRVLVVEDDEAFNYTVCRTFARAGAEAIAATNGAEALSILERESFDIILVDMLLGDMNGRTLLEQIASTSAIKVAISASDEALEGMRPLQVHTIFRKQGDIDRLADSLVASAS